MRRKTRVIESFPWGRVLVACGIAGLVVHVAAGVDTTLGTWSYDLLVAGAAIAVVVRAIKRPEHRLAWGLIGAGMVSWAAGDIYYNEVLLDRTNVPYPSLADGLYFGMYAALLAGLAILRGRANRQALLSSGIVVSVLGLATIWSLLVLDKVVGDAEGATAAVATTVAYPLLDLALLLSAILAFATRGWRFDRVLGMLSLGFLLVAVADSVYATQVAAEQSWSAVVDSMWPAGALAIAISAWLEPSPRPPHTDPEQSLTAIAAVSAGGAAGVLIYDHFDRLETATVILAGLTLVVACAQLVIVGRERRRASSRASRAEALRSASTEAALDCVISVDAEGIVLDWNRAARRTFGYTADEAIGRELADLIVPEPFRDAYHRGLARASDGPLIGARTELLACTSRGSTIPVEVTVSQVSTTPPIFTGFVRDISDRKRRDEENERLASIVRFSEDAMLTADADGRITAWNHGAESLYGYTAEEALGHTITSLLVPPERQAEMRKVSAKVRDGEPVAIETQRYDRDGNLIDIGLRVLPMRDHTGNIIGSSSTAHDITDRRLREERVRRDREGREWRERVEEAMSDGRLSFWAQPVVEPRSHQVDHHELLLRMELDGEIITPNHFLPHAERSELITEIDRWAVRHGAELARRMPVAINLSAKSLGDPRLLHEIEEALADPRIARRVTFEITETAAAQNLSRAHELVTALTTLGCGVALDDFGTGYGSFTYLKHLPVTELKIDIQFVRGLLDDPANQRVVRSLVDVAGNFDMRTVAEGVEDEATLELLRTFGVDLVQGYHLGRPAPLKLDAHEKKAKRAAARPVHAGTKV